jgi:hypothetical protein
MKLNEPHSLCGCCEGEKNLFPLPEIEPLRSLYQLSYHGIYLTCVLKFNLGHIFVETSVQALSVHFSSFQIGSSPWFIRWMKIWMKRIDRYTQSKADDSSIKTVSRNQRELRLARHETSPPLLTASDYA